MWFRILILKCIYIYIYLLECYKKVSDSCIGKFRDFIGCIKCKDMNDVMLY